MLHVIDERILDGIRVFLEALGNGRRRNADEKRVSIGDLTCHLLCFRALVTVQDVLVRMPLLHKFSVRLFECPEINVLFHFKQPFVRIDPLHSDRFFMTCFESSASLRGLLKMPSAIHWMIHRANHFLKRLQK